MPCESATVPAAVNSNPSGSFCRGIPSHWSAGPGRRRTRNESEDLPCTIGCLLLRRKGVPEVAADLEPVFVTFQPFFRSRRSSDGPFAVAWRCGCPVLWQLCRLGDTAVLFCGRSAACAADCEDGGGVRPPRTMSLTC